MQNENTHRLGMGSIRKVGTERVSVFSQQDDTPFFIIEVMELEWDTYREGRLFEHEFYSMLLWCSLNRKIPLFY